MELYHGSNVPVEISGVEGSDNPSGHNATARNRMSVLDITEDGEEPDPLNTAFGNDKEATVPPVNPAHPAGSKFCPYCGSPVGDDFAFCNNCGKKLP